MRRVTLVFVVLYVLIVQAFAQKSSISGKVVDVNNKTLAGVNIVLKGSVRAVKTNVKGEYTITKLDSGLYSIEVSALGFVKQTNQIQLNHQQNLELNFTLQNESLVLSEVIIRVNKGIRGNEHLPEVGDFSIYAGKKNEVIEMANINANLAMNNSRQIFSKTPGISVWENDGSGVQLGVASRGLSPNRSWEFNVRMNGYDITPDPMGYPEAYYTPPMEVVDRIEIIRGASSLQYGPQFGGLMNFVVRKPDISTKFTFESQNTVGNNGLFSTFNYIGGTEGRLSYTAYYQKRVGNGWREHSAFNTDHAHMELSYAVNNKLRIGADLTYMATEIQQAGGLNDLQFSQNPRQGLRSRNWFSTPWFIPALTAEYIINDRTKVSWKTFGTFAERNSVGFVQAINQVDNIGNRQVDRDLYNTIGSEVRMLSDYKFMGLNNTLATGLRYYKGRIDRKQFGKGTSGKDMDFELVDPIYPRDLDFNNVNRAAFIENIFRINDKLLFTGGLRFENIGSSMAGRFGVVNGQNVNLIPATRTRNFLLLGFGAEYHATRRTEFYANFSEAYRPVLISDLTPPATTDVIDPNLRDAKGFNFDVGYRGKVGNYLNFDVDYFFLNYDDRIGTLTQGSAGNFFQFRTNLGKSVSKGFEAYIEFDPFAAFIQNVKYGSLSLFASLAHVNASYRDFQVASVVNGQLTTTNLAGKRVENAPRSINRFGATYDKNLFSITWQLSYIGKAYADASNTVLPNSTATTGLIPSYQVQDLSASFKFLKNYNLKGGINNLMNRNYFTRRAGGYPGPGLMPADGRTFYLSAGIKL
jgi:Fe(3+) dicitrate transport protein